MLWRIMLKIEAFSSLHTTGEKGEKEWVIL